MNVHSRDRHVSGNGDYEDAIGDWNPRGIRQRAREAELDLQWLAGA